nr:TIGR03943 family protein [Pseudanabaena sp. PCC 6802]
MGTRSQQYPKLFRSVAPWLDVLAIGGWGILLLKLWLFDQLSLLVHPNYFWMTVVAGFFLVAIAAAEARQVMRRHRSQQTGQTVQHVTLLLPGWSSSLLLITALLGLIVTPQPFASDTAIQRGVNDSLTATRAVPQSFRANSRSEERSLVDWIRTINVYPEPDTYVGQKAKVQGFVVYPKDLPEQYFLISRFVITCCAADVYPVSLPVKTEQGRSAYPSDRWLEVEGQMITIENNGKRQLAIQASKIVPISPPRNPYEY